MWCLGRRKKGYVIVSRNKENNQFYIRSVRNFIKEIKRKKSNWFIFVVVEKLKTEKQIIEMMNNGKNFFIDNPTAKTFTEVIISFNNIKSKPNDTTDDNLTSLPIFYN